MTNMHFRQMQIYMEKIRSGGIRVVQKRGQNDTNRMSGRDEREYEVRLREKRREMKIKQQKQRLIVYAVSIILVFLMGVLVGRGCGKKSEVAAATETESMQITLQLPRTEEDEVVLPDYVDEQYLTVNKYSRPGKKVSRVNAVVVHYIANPGTTAQQNRDYFEELSISGETSISSNFVIGLEGEIIACVPPGEVAYASNQRNQDTVSIENCHPDESGEFTSETYASLVKLTAWLCDTYELDPLDGGVIRHYDVTEKICPKHFVENPEEWQDFLEDVDNEMNRL